MGENQVRVTMYVVYDGDHCRPACQFKIRESYRAKRVMPFCMYFEKRLEKERRPKSPGAVVRRCGECIDRFGAKK